MIVLLTSRALYELDPLDPQKLLRRIPHREIHQIASVLEQSLALRMVLYSPIPVPVKVKAEGWGFGDSLVTYTKVVDYLAPTDQDLADWMLAATHVLNLYWQRLFEGDRFFLLEMEDRDNEVLDVL